MITARRSRPRVSVRHVLVRAATATLFRALPNVVVDPRGLILDTAPGGGWVLRVRAGGGHWCLAPESEAWREGHEVLWRMLDPADDAALPGRGLLRDDAALAGACGLDRIDRKTVVQYRVGRRAVVRVEGTRGSTRGVVYGKLLRRKQAARAAALFAILERSGSCVFVTPDAVDLERALLTFDEVDGQALHDVLWRAEAVPVAEVATVLRTLAASPNTGLPTSNVDPRRAALRQLDNGRVLIPELARLQRAIAGADEGALDEGALMDAWSQAGEHRGVCHGDLHDKQIFHSDTGIRVIDADGVAAGPPVWDWVNLVEHMRLRGLQGATAGPNAAADLQQALGLRWESRDLQLMRTMVRARLAGVYALRPWWWEVSMQLMEEAERGLQDLGVAS